MLNNPTVHLITLAAFPYHSAESIHLAMFSKAMAQLCSFKLVTPIKLWRKQTWSKNLIDQYGIENSSFAQRKIIQLTKSGKIFIRKALTEAKNNSALVYARQYIVVTSAVRRSMPTVWEIHTLPSQSQMEFIRKTLSIELKNIVVISHALKKDISKIAGLSSTQQDRILVAPDAADHEKFQQKPIDLLNPKIGYIGSAYPGKGIEIIIPLARLLKDIIFEVYGVEKSDESLKKFGEIPSNINWHGKVHYSKIPVAMSTFDIGLLPNQPSVILKDGTDIGKYTSPMKMFEYMAAGKVIIASDLAIIREVIQPNVNGLLAPHNQPEAWSEIIQRTIANPSNMVLISKLALKCFKDNYTYTSRAKQIITQINFWLTK